MASSTATDPDSERQGLAAPPGSKWSRLARRVIAAQPRLALVAWAIAGLLWAGSLALAWLCWFVWMPELWAWRGSNIVFTAAGIAAGSLFLALIPMWGWMLAYAVSEGLLEATAVDEKASIAAARERVRETEEDALQRLEKTDEAGLLPLLRYSRAQLDAYYAMGLGQTRRAFVNAALAMWLGFLLLIAGIALYIAPLGQFGIAPPASDFNLLILASAVIIEVVSALFLWVYRSTIGQLTFYYRLQMQSHAAILSFRIAASMSDPATADAGKRAVIDKLLAAAPDPERPAVAGAKGLRALLPAEAGAG